MIPEAEVRRMAAAAGVDTMVQDLDYALGWFLSGLFTALPQDSPLVFKGGTCLRKCYFANYRFSEDLDFTLIRVWSVDAFLLPPQQPVSFTVVWQDVLGVLAALQA